MNGRAARELRKAVNFIPSAKREYYEFNWKVKRKIAQVNLDGEAKVEFVERLVDAYTKECVSAERKFYKYLKRKYYNFEHEEQLNALPSQEDLNDTIKQFKEDLQNARKRGISNETNESGRENE